MITHRALDPMQRAVGEDSKIKAILRSAEVKGKLNSVQPSQCWHIFKFSGVTMCISNIHSPWNVICYNRNLQGTKAWREKRGRETLWSQGFTLLKIKLTLMMVFIACVSLVWSHSFCKLDQHHSDPWAQWEGGGELKKENSWIEIKTRAEMEEGEKNNSYIIVCVYIYIYIYM